LNNTKTEKISPWELLKPAVILLIICGICASLLAAVYVITKEKISENALAEESRAIMDIFPEYASHETVKMLHKDCLTVARVYDSENNLLGYAATVAPMGFKAEINTVVGVSVDLKVIKTVITSMSETAGIGTKVNNPSYLDTYIGMSTDIAFGNGVEAISGATKSSKAFLSGVKSAVEACGVLYGNGEPKGGN